MTVPYEPPTCIHTDHGLCSACQEEYDVDPEAYFEFGEHPAGIERWKALTDEMAAEAAENAKHSPPEPDPDLPF